MFKISTRFLTYISTQPQKNYDHTRSRSNIFKKNFEVKIYPAYHLNPSKHFFKRFSLKNDYPRVYGQHSSLSVH
eukprot:UN02393